MLLGRRSGRGNPARFKNNRTSNADSLACSTFLDLSIQKHLFQGKTKNKKRKEMAEAANPDYSIISDFYQLLQLI